MKMAFYKANAHTIIGNIRQRSNSKSKHVYHSLLYMQENTMSLLTAHCLFGGLKEVISACLFIDKIMIFHNDLLIFNFEYTYFLLCKCIFHTIALFKSQYGN